MKRENNVNWNYYYIVQDLEESTKSNNYLKGLSSENDMGGYVIEKSVLISNSKFRRMNSFWNQHA